MHWPLRVTLKGIVQLQSAMIRNELQKIQIRETVTVFLVENGEESQLKNLRVFLKQTATPPPPDLLLFIIACFIPLKSNSSVKTISISADKDFSPLSRYLFIKNVNKYENRLYKLLIQLKHCTELFLSDLQLTFC